MQEIEKTGKNVEEAVEAALKELGCTRDDVEVEVVSESGRGLLGIFGQTEARVKVTLKESAEAVVEAEPEPEVTEPEEEEAEPPEEPEPRKERPRRKPPRPSAEGEESVGERAANFAQQMLSAMNIEAEAYVSEEDDEGAMVEIDAGQDTGLVIGRRGDTLTALQHLVAIMANRGREDNKRVLLNAGGYLERREQALQTLARRTAQRVRASRRSVTLEALSPRERRIVHLALADERGITTSSVGEDPNRCVVVSPTKGGGGGERRRPSGRRQPQSEPHEEHPPAKDQPPWRPDDDEEDDDEIEWE